MDDARLAELARECGATLRREGLQGPAVLQSFALAREAVERTTGARLYPVQVLGGYAMLSGHVVEMATGEGKTLTAVPAAATAALAGLPVHVVTVNDYLVRRDCEITGPAFRLLGLTTDAVVHELTPDARRRAYGADVTYCSNKELVFDYLRDRIAVGAGTGRIEISLERLYRAQPRDRKLVLRGLGFAIVDEIDSVLIDEARTPLIISATGNGSWQQDAYPQALELAQRLETDRDYEIHSWQRRVALTEDGTERLRREAEPLGGIWRSRRAREELVTKALTALFLHQRDKHYIVADGKVQIVDEFTGRVMADRSWEGGLHQLVECKEGCPMTSPRETIARLTYQRFFRRYLRLAGMSGTVREVAGELWDVYRLRVLEVPTHRPVRRRIGDACIFDFADEKWQAVVDRVSALHRDGRPVLIGTRSVAASELVSGLLRQHEIDHRVLNARQDLEEAETVARAGGRGRVTVATNMAGRGTDIQLEPGVDELGGLHVILTEPHEARRIDRQLFGRCGRQGDAGSCEAMLSMEDELVTAFLARHAWSRAMLTLRNGRLGDWSRRAIVYLAQVAAERRHARTRRETLDQDERLDTMLSFSGRVE
jgi:preprotein translocase subunit SecA